MPGGDAPADAAAVPRAAAARGGARYKTPATRPHAPQTAAVAATAMVNMATHMPGGTTEGRRNRTRRKGVCR